ncbi:MAG: sel1 repeat family protein, partial [Parabacteroides sp.]|nr:sel1 repeat family protein [Parabacteroides sp.]
MKARIFSYFVLTIIGSVWISLSAQERNFKGDHKIYLSRIEEQIKSFYDVTIECVTDVENQSLLIENMKNEILTASCVCIPDFMNYSDADGMYSYENYLAHFMRQYSSLLKTSTMLEFRQEDLKIEKAVYTEDEQGVQFNVSFNNILADNESEKILYTSRSQAVIVFPKIHQLLNRKIRQISSWNRGGAKALNTQTKEVKTEDTESIYQKGLSFYNEKNYVEAVKWYRKAADQGHAGAQFALSDCLFYGRGITKNEEEAIKWLRISADQGYAI